MVTLAYLAGLVLEALGLTSTILTISQYLQAVLGIAPQGQTVFSQFAILSQHMSTIDAEIAALSTKDDIIISDISTLATAIGAIPTAPQLAGHAVTLPSTAPAGYGADNTGAAHAVWSYILGQGEDAGSALDDLYGSRISLFSNTFASIPGAPWMVAWNLTGWQNYASGNIVPPAILDERTILPTDASILAWANRTGFGTYGWTDTHWRAGTVPMQLDQNRADVKWIITMTPAEFAAFQVIPKTPLEPPIWPGVDNVDFLPLTHLAERITIDGPMDGVIIMIGTAPSRLPFFQFSALKSFKYLGALAFVNDNLDVEAWQTISFTDGLYTPKTMKRATSVYIRTTGGVTGDVIPWTISP